jgi:hypothetical protein
VARTALVFIVAFSAASATVEKSLTDPLDVVLERAHNIFLVEVTFLHEEGYAKANVETVVKGHYENEIWVVRRMHNDDMFPFTPGRRYVIFAKRVMGDTYLPDYDESLYAVRLVDFEDQIDVTPFEGHEYDAVSLESFITYCKAYLDPFKPDGTFEGVTVPEGTE